MKLPLYRRSQINNIKKGLTENPELIHIIIGPRQTGKTTLALQIREEWKGDSIYASADTPLPPGPEWLMHEWSMAGTANIKPVLLILDDVDKIKGWSETIKQLRDQDYAMDKGLTILLLG